MKSEKQLYQWDTNQSLVELTPSAQFVDYPIGDEVIRIKSDGTRCRIPDEVLQTYGVKTCYERYPDGTFRAYSFPVLYAPKPPDYVYTPEERTTFEALTARVDAAIEDIKRRADSGEFDGKTPVKGVDYYTKEEQAELITAVSSGAESEFRKVTEAETAKFEATAESELTAYNRNAAEKLEAYNSNHAAKVAEYNQNAKTKTAEFDANAAALQTEVDRLRGECDNLAAENRKQENKISALMKLNKGQTYDILPEEGESANRTAPSGAKYVSVDKVGGKSIVWNQLYDRTKPTDGENNGITFSRQEDGSFVATGKNNDGTMSYVYSKINVTAGHIYFSKSIKLGDVGKSYLAGVTIGSNAYDRGNGALATASQTGIASFVVQMFEKGAEAKNEVVRPRVFDLTLMFGVGNEPTAEQFTAMFPAESYPYNPGEIISSRTETITVGTESVTTGFQELRSAMAAHDYIDMDGGKVHRKIKSVRIDGETPIYSVRTDQDNCYRVVFTPETSPGIVISEEPTIPTNIISDKLATITHNNYWSADAYTGIEAYPGYASISMRLQDRTDLDTKEKVSAWLADNPTTVYYETESDELTDVTIPEALTEWLPVEAGGTVTFRNADESKQLPVPNAVSWVRKLNEVN